MNDILDIAENIKKEKYIMVNEKLNIGIIVGTTREGRVSPQVAKWVKEIADERKDANYTIVDIKDFKLPFLGETTDMGPVTKWGQTIGALDGFVFVTGEYNHGVPAPLKNALDWLKDQWNNKAAGIVSYGSTGGARAAEHLRGILAELQVASVRTHPTLSIFLDFEKMTTFKPQALHKGTVNLMLDQVLAWSKALKTVRK